MEQFSYESDALLHQYLLFHYGPAQEQLPWATGPSDALYFPQRCVQEGLDLASLPSRGSALDIGCAVGGASFEFARQFERTIGIDYSSSFVRAAGALLEQGELEVEVVDTGTRRHTCRIKRPHLPTGHLVFEQGDAQDLRPDLGEFDAVLAANLLCRLARPQAFIDRLPQLVRPGGQLIITTPNTWLESFTAREFWIGATPETGEPMEALQERLEPNFQLDRTWDMPFLIREHSRKYQWSVAQASRWIRHR